LKQKVRQYSDYDDIKRELEIMKVCLAYSETMGESSLTIRIVCRICRRG
jgi:hypothetical protein